MTGEWPSQLANRPQLIADAYAMELRDAWLGAEAEAQAMASASRSFDNSRARYTIIDGVAVIPISGALLNRHDFIGDGSPYTSYPALTREVRRAAADTAIRGIVLTVNSPGGTADGTLAPAAAIRDARKVKPVTAFVGSMAASGGYWLAAQANEIVLSDDMSRVGSIGVYTTLLGFSRMLDRAGIDISVISSGAHKVDEHPLTTLSDDTRSRIQQEVDDLRVMFAREVAAGRPSLSEKAVLATEAKMFRAVDPKSGRRPAIEAKLADRMGSLPSVIAGIAAGAAPKPSRIKGATTVDETQIRASERTRINEILTSQHAAGREGQASYLALNTSMTAAEAVGLLAASPKVDATAATPAPAQTYEQRKAQAGGLSYVDTGAATPQAKASAGWSKAVAAANKGLGLNTMGDRS